MAEWKRIIVHCSDSFWGSAPEIRKWHTDPKPNGRGWSDIGYHYYIKLDGSVWKGRPIEKAGSHCYGKNSTSIGICFEGGLKKKGVSWDKPTDEQIRIYKELERDIFAEFGELKVSGHYQYSNKTCPNFDINILK